MKNKLLVVFNICGLGNIENYKHYIRVIYQLLNQNFDNYKIVISSCLNSNHVRNKLEQEFKDNVSYNYINDVLPIPVTFNDTVLESIKQHGRFESYFYIESGLDFAQNANILKELYDCMKSGPFSIVSGMVDTDAGYDEHNLDIKNDCGHFIIPVGKAINGHATLYSDELLQYYGQCWPSIFSSYCNESVTSFVAAALKTNWVLCTKSIIHHIEEMDGRSSGFSPVKWAQSGRSLYDHPFIIPSIMERICTQECWQYGLGYEECHDIMLHRPDQFNENGFCINDKLKEICKTKLFLQPEEFNYDNINHRYIK